MARRTASDPVSAEVLPPLDWHCPPAYVRRKRDGIVTRWSSLFKANIDDFEPFYREGSEDAMNHMLAIQDYQVVQSRFGGRRPVMSMAGIGDLIDGDYSGVDN